MEDQHSDPLERIFSEWRCVPDRGFEDRLQARLDQMLQEGQARRQNGKVGRLVFRPLPAEYDEHNRASTPAHPLATAASVILVGGVLALFALVPFLWRHSGEASATAAVQPTESIPTPTSIPTPAVKSLGSGIPITSHNAAQLVEVARSPEPYVSIVESGTTLVYYPERDIQFSADNRLLGKGLMVWDLVENKWLAFSSHLTDWRIDETGNRMWIDGATFQHIPSVLTPDGSAVIAAAKNRLVWFDVQGQQEELVLMGDLPYRSDTLALSPDGRWLVGGCCTWGDDMHSVTVIDLATNTVVLSRLVADPVRDIDISPDHTLVAAGGSDIVLIDPTTGRVSEALDGGRFGITDLDFSPDGTMIAAGSFDGSVGMWNIDSGEERLRLNVVSSSVDSIAFSPDGSMLAAVTRTGAAYLWDAATGAALLTLPAEEDSSRAEGTMWAITFSPDGSLLAVADLNGTIRIFAALGG